MLSAVRAKAPRFLVSIMVGVVMTLGKSLLHHLEHLTRASRPTSIFRDGKASKGRTSLARRLPLSTPINGIQGDF